MKHDESQVYLLNKVADYIKRAEKRVLIVLLAHYIIFLHGLMIQG